MLNMVNAYHAAMIAIPLVVWIIALSLLLGEMRDARRKRQQADRPRTKDRRNRP